MDEQKNVKPVIFHCTNEECDNTFVYSEDDIKEMVGTIECTKCGRIMINSNPEIQ